MIKEKENAVKHSVEFCRSTKTSAPGVCVRSMRRVFEGGGTSVAVKREASSKRTEHAFVTRHPSCVVRRAYFGQVQLNTA